MAKLLCKTWNLQLAKVPGVSYGDPLDRIIAEFASGVCQVGRPQSKLLLPPGEIYRLNRPFFYLFLESFEQKHAMILKTCEDSITIAASSAAASLHET